MSKLEELIEELCPDGVEYKALGEICIRQKGTSITASDMKRLDKPNAPIRIFAAGNTVANVANGDIPEKDVIKKTSIIVKSRGNIGFEYYTEPFSHKNEMWSYSANDSDINLKFVYYYLKNHIREFQLKAKTGKLPQISTLDTDRFMIPIPPLPVQREIVRILDNFTELIAELITELTMRKKQYDYYRDELLCFNNPSVEWTTLGELGKISMCRRIMKAETTSDGEVPFYKIGTFGGQPNAYISREIFEKYKTLYSYPEKGDILISAAGTIGRTVVFDGQPAYFQDSNIVWIANDESKVLNSFLYYYYQLQPWQVSTGGTISRLYNDNISKAKIPIFPIKEQECTVAILDRFDTLCNDISAGLPAEIEARQKQYEYYRDKLLTFKELS